MSGAHVPPGVPRLLTAQEAAHVLRTTAATVRGMARGGGLPHLRLGPRLLFPLDALTNWIIANTEVPGNATTTKASEWGGERPPSPRATVPVGRRRHRRVDHRRKADPPKPLRVIGASGEEVVGGDEAGTGGR